MSNWYLNCPVCEDEVECHVEDCSAPDGLWTEVDLPNECPNCEADLTKFPSLEDEVVEHWSWRNEKPEDVDDEIEYIEYFEK